MVQILKELSSTKPILAYSLCTHKLVNVQALVLIGNIKMIWACENHSEPAQGPICSSHTYTFSFPSGRGLRVVAFYVSGHGITGSQP